MARSCSRVFSKREGRSNREGPESIVASTSGHNRAVYASPPRSKQYTASNCNWERPDTKPPELVTLSFTLSQCRCIYALNYLVHVYGELLTINTNNSERPNQHLQQFARFTT